MVSADVELVLDLTPAALSDDVGAAVDYGLVVRRVKLLTARPTVLQNRKSAAAALRYPTSPVVTYFVLPGKDLPMPAQGRRSPSGIKPSRLRSSD